MISKVDLLKNLTEEIWECKTIILFIENVSFFKLLMYEPLCFLCYSSLNTDLDLLGSESAFTIL